VADYALLIRPTNGLPISGKQQMAGSVACGRTYPRTWTGGRGVHPGCTL